MNRLGLLVVTLMVLVVFSACGSGGAEDAAPQGESVAQQESVSSGGKDAEMADGQGRMDADAHAGIAPLEQSELDVPADRAQSAAPEGYSAMPLPGEMRAMWISFLEWQAMDISTEEAMRANVGQMLDNCAALGINTVIVSVRPFSDALYKSGIFPWSHLISGQQGADPGYDPLEVMTEEAHSRNLRVEAWINPFRVKSDQHGPESLADSNPAVQNPSWVREQNGLWLDPGLPEVRKLVVDGVTEIVENYDVDGIHLDDYFYPEGNTGEFDSATYEQYGGGQELAVWRRENINEMVRSMYSAVKSINPTVSFGISPQGNNENNYNDQYCDIKMWMAGQGYADYIMPQLYWGFDYMDNGSDKASFSNKVAEWSSYPLDGSVRLYAGLGAYRIGDGDYSDVDNGEWKSGHNIADMVAYLRENGMFSGFALFHYLSLYPGEDSPYAEIAANEAAALKNIMPAG